MSKKLKILIVEDESIVAVDLKRTLMKFDYQIVDVVSKGEDAITTALQTKPGLILMDIMLDGKTSGIKAAEKIKENLDIPIIYLTAYADAQTIKAAKITEPFGYILKPYDERMLHSSIEMAVFKYNTNLELKRSEERYRELVESAPIAIGIHCEGKVVYVNSFAVKLFGAKDEKELLGKPVLDLVFPSFRDLVIDRVHRATHHKEKLEAIEEKLVRLDGLELDVDVSAIPTEYQGKPAVEVVIRDISEIKKKERIYQATLKILQSVNLVQSLEEQLDYLHKTLLDFIEIKNLFFAFYNKTRNEITFPFFTDEFDAKPKDRKFGNGLIEYAFNSGRAQLLTGEEIKDLVRQNNLLFNEKLPKKWMSIPLDINENLTLILVFKEYIYEHYLGQKELELMNSVLLPLTRAIERKLLEDEKKETLNKLEELNHTKDNFFSIIAHDLRSPFDSILGFTEILKNELSDLSKEELKLYTDSLYQSSRHIYHLINNLLQYSRFQLGKTKVLPKRLNINEIILSTIEILNGVAVKKEIELIFKKEEQIFVYADEEMTNSILLNLITNAIKFSYRGKSILISTSIKNGFAAISIQDFGIGISNQALRNLFRLNAQKSNPGTENETGTGLGLLIVQQFVELNGGLISVNSEPLKGSTFTFTLPLFSSQKDVENSSI